MAKSKFYAVALGRKPGIYQEWFGARGAEVQVRGFAGAVFKGFAFRHEAEAWLAKMSEGAPGQSRLPWEETAARESPRAKQRSGKAPPADAPVSPETVPGARVVIYTDGGCSRNPGPGGYGAVILADGGRKELSGGYARTTNNRMELTACIKALEALEGVCSVALHSDSQYVVNGIMKGWARKWRKNNWMRNADERAENSDLWSRLLDLCERHDVRFQWVRGHNGNKENERCDALAVEMTRRGDLPPDRGYEKN